MNFTNRTLYDKDLILEYNKYFLSAYLKKNFVIMSSISLVFIIYMLAIGEWKYAIILFGILMFYLLMTFLMQKVTTRRVLRRSPLVTQPVMQTYEFTEHNIKVINVKEYIVEYSDITKYKKGKDFYILKTRDKKTFIVTYKGFARASDIEDFSDFLKEKLRRK
jgi:ABC-type multidrug transport system fused ATPase/permease subunit